MGDSVTIAKVLSGLADSDLFAFVLLDSSGVIVFANRSAVSLLGLTASDVVGRTYRDPEWAVETTDGGPFPVDDLPFAQVMRLRRSVTDVRLAIRWPDGTRKCLSTAAEPVLDHSTGEIAFVAVTLQDVTEAVEAMHRLEEARRRAEDASLAREKFLATMSHEMRTPLHAVLGAMELLGAETEGRQQKSLIRQAEESARILLDIIEDVLDISRLTADVVKIQKNYFNMNELIGDIAKVVRGLYKTTSLDVIFDVDEHVPCFIVGDRKRVRQILLNLIGNAMKFTERGRVVFSVQVVSETEAEIVLRFKVSDTGMGVPEEWREAIFDAFSQVDGSRDRRFGGSGLGLAISRQLARLMGGDVRVQSEPGQGSSFWFEAPFSRGGPVPDADWPRQGSGTSSRRAAIVIANDPLEREAFAKAARRAGMSVLQISSLLDASGRIELLKKYDDLILIVKSDMFYESSHSLMSWARETPQGVTPRFLLVRNGVEEGVVKNMPIIDHVVTAPLTSIDIQDVMSANGVDRKERRMKALPVLSGKRILLVEDSPANARLAMAMLKVHGMVVDWKDNGQAGLDALMAAPDRYEAVLIDIQMPGMDGYEVVRRMRRVPVLKALPAMAVTANAFPEDQERAFDAGFDMFLAKPFTSSELGQSLQNLLALAPTGRSSDADGQAVNGGDGDRVRPASFDVARALERMDGSDDLLRSFVKDALPHFEASAAQARRAVAASRIDDATRELHTLKGLAATLSADMVMERAEAMRTSLRAGSLPDERNWLDLEMDCSDLIQDLLAYLRKPVTYSRSLEQCLADLKACLDSGSLRAVDCAIEAERFDPALTGLASMVRSGNIVRARALLDSFAQKRVDV